MNDDKDFRELLLRHAVEETSADFTEKTMGKIYGIRAGSYANQPFIKHAIKLAYTVIFVVVVLALIALSTFIKPTDLPYDVRLPLIRIEHFYNTLYFIISFWLLMLINYYYERRSQQNNWS
jgi:hypothetical protein